MEVHIKSKPEILGKPNSFERSTTKILMRRIK
jgi:hypothetical protein